MTRLLIAIAVMISACSGRDRAPPAAVPMTWQEVRTSAGHTVHVGTANVPCRDCHGEKGFARPPAEICARCHGAVQTPLHPADPIGIVPLPVCQDCHGFGIDQAIRPTSCMRCHDKPQGLHTPEVGAHADQACSDCHRAHGTPTLDVKPCISCHQAQTTKHAGTRGCLDCHSMHEPALVADTTCVTCHTKQRAPAKVTFAAITTGHPKCSSCHEPHGFTAEQAKPCASCHQNKPVLAVAKHATCMTCHNGRAVPLQRACGRDGDMLLGSQ